MNQLFSNINYDFVTILGAIFGLILVLVFGVILFESLIPTMLNKTHTGLLALLLISLIGISFLYVPQKKVDNKKPDKYGNNYVYYIILLFSLTMFNFLF